MSGRIHAFSLVALKCFLLLGSFSFTDGFNDIRDVAVRADGTLTDTLPADQYISLDSSEPTEERQSSAPSLLRTERKNASSISDIEIASNVNFSDLGPSPAKPGPAKWCTLSGDPHVKTFDSRHHQWHPMHAPGHWWLVRTDSKLVSIQAIYGGCGKRTHGGWQRTKVKGVPRTCIKAIAVSGDFIKGSCCKTGPHTLVVKSACDWDYEKMVCRNNDQQTRLTWNGNPVPVSLNKKVKLNEKIYVNVQAAKVDITLPDKGKIIMWNWGKFDGKTNAVFNVHIYLPKYKASYCGHCGNFNGNEGDDRIYGQDGIVHKGKDALCDAAVHCRDRLIDGGTFGSYTKAGKSSEKCIENPAGVAFGLSDCPADKLAKAKRNCNAAFKKDSVASSKDLLNDCLLDECLADGFAKADADDAVHEKKEGCAKR